MRTHFLWLLAACWIGVASLPSARAASRPGAPRPLVPVAAGESGGGRDDAALAANIRGEAPCPSVGRRGEKRIYFVRQSQGTRNIWMATLQVDERGAQTPAGRNISPRWWVRPLTRLRAPLWASSPLVARGGRVLCVTNAALDEGIAPDANGHRSSRLARIDGEGAILSALSEKSVRVASPSLSPDGLRIAFVSNRGGRETVEVMPSGGGPAQPIADWGRAPCWLDGATVLYQSLPPARSGLFRVALALGAASGSLLRASRPRLFLEDGREAAVAPRGRSVCAVVLGARRNDVPRLVLLSSDGSGARVLAETRGARRPAFDADGSTLFYDAPLDERGRDESSRALWNLPLLRVPPVAVLQGARLPSPKANSRAMVGNMTVGRAGSDTLEIIGTAFSEESGALDVRLEVAPGDDEDKATWTALPARNSTVQDGVLATWTPPRGARDEWMVRLTVIDASGDRAQNILPLTLPLLPPFDPAQIRAAPTPEIVAAPMPTPILPPRIAVAPTPPRAVPKTDLRRPTPLRRRVKQRGMGATMPILPLPALPPPPARVRDATPDNSEQISNAVAIQTVPDRYTIEGDARTRDDRSKPIRRPRESRIRDRAPASSGGRASVTRKSPSRATPTISDAAFIDVSGTPAVMAPGATTRVEVAMRNLGRTNWNANGAQPVRLMYRWVDRASGFRRRWAYNWLRAPVAAGTTVRLDLAVTAPPKAGRYKLIYALIRLAPDNANVPPATDAVAQEQWPGEFGSAVYAVNIE